MKSLNEMRELSLEDLQNELLALRKNQFALRMKQASGALEKTHEIRQLRKAVARLKTIMTEKAGK